MGKTINPAPQQIRAAQSDEGQDILHTADVFQGDTHDIIGNVGHSAIYDFFRWGWIDGDGITAKGKEMMEWVRQINQRA